MTASFTITNTLDTVDAYRNKLGGLSDEQQYSAYRQEEDAFQGLTEALSTAIKVNVQGRIAVLAQLLSA